MIAPRLEKVTGWYLNRLAQILAAFGGCILILLALISVVSILGRWINMGGFRAINGDYELIEAGTAIAVFAFLPLCQLNRGHVTVDLLVERFPIFLQNLLTLLGDLVIAIVAFVVMWRLYLGFGEKLPFFSQETRDILSMGYKPFFPETTYELEIPLWQPMGLALIGAVIFFIVSAYTVWRSFNQFGAKP